MNALRKLAEEIANAQAHDTGPLRPQLIDHWEARLRSALTELSELLGELAALQDAACNASQLIDGFRDPDDAGWSEWDEETYQALLSAQSSEASRLAAELIRADTALRATEEAREAMVAETITGGDPGAWQRGDNALRIAQDRRERALDALLARFPGMREEVER